MPSRQTKAIEEEIDRITFQVDLDGQEARAGTEAGHGAPLRRIVLGVDGSTVSALAVKWAAELGERFGATVHVVHAVPRANLYTAYLAMPHGDREGYDEMRKGVAETVLKDAAAVLKKAGVEHELHQVEGSPGDVITRLAEEHDAGLIIVGAHEGPDVKHPPLGSISAYIRDHAACNVLFVRDAPRPQRVVVPVDGSPASRRAAALALRLARAWEAEGDVLHVAEVPPGAASPTLDALRERYTKSTDWADPDVTFDLRMGRPHEAILDHVEEDGERRTLVVMGSRGLSGLRSLVAGSVSTRVTHAAPCSVMVVKEEPVPSDVETGTAG